jgi:hypothetical protein
MIRNLLEKGIRPLLQILIEDHEQSVAEPFSPDGQIPRVDAIRKTAKCNQSMRGLGFPT